MMVLIDRKFNEEQLLLETFSLKMHIERDIRKKVISKRLKPPLKKLRLGEVRVLICCLGQHSLNIFRPFSKLWLGEVRVLICCLGQHSLNIFRPFFQFILQFFFLICLEPRL